MLRIKELCKEKGITLAELAKRLNITPGALSRNVAGNVGLDRLNEIARILDVTVLNLFDAPNEDFYGIIIYKGKTYKLDSLESLKRLVTLSESGGQKGEL